MDDKKKKLFDKYSYYQVINAYKNIFSLGIEDIDDIENNINNNIDLERYRKCFSIPNTVPNERIFRCVLVFICKEYGINYKYSDLDVDLKNKIKQIKYYNHLYSDKVIYSDFIRIYKFEHELRNVLLKYSLIIEESLKNILVTYLNNIEAKASFLTEINEYDTSQQNISSSIDSIKKIFDKQTNRHSNPIKRKNDQELLVPYWIIINELTLGETIKVIINLDAHHRQNILEICVNYFTNVKLDKSEIGKSIDKDSYYNKINVMREILNIIGILRNNLAHNQPIYLFNVSDFSSSKSGNLHYHFPNKKSQHEQFVLNTKYMSYLAEFFGSDKYNTFTGNKNIDLSWVIYVLYKIILNLDNNTNMYYELIYVYKKYNIILTPDKVAFNKYELYNKMLSELDYFSQLDLSVNSIKEKYNNNEPIKRDLISLNKRIREMQENIKKSLKDNEKNNETLKYNHFLFDNMYTKYTGIDKKFFDKLINKK